MPRWTPFEPYFWSLVKKASGDSCWEWLGGKDGKGYARVWRNGRRQGAHRVSYEITTGKIPDGLQVCHRCDNKMCVRPSHLFVGTQGDNMQDWTRKGKNSLVNDRSLWSMGKHWAVNHALRRSFSDRMKAEFRNGQRRTLPRGPNGRLTGTRICSTTKTS